MFGSMVYNNVTTSASKFPVTQVLVCTLGAASACFFLPAYVRDEAITLWCFCVFEVCCGLYYPAMASLKGKLVEDGARASVYGILRVPLNAFVVLALSTTKEGTRAKGCSVSVFTNAQQESTTETWYSRSAAGCYWSRRSWCTGFLHRSFLCLRLFRG